MLVFGYSHCPDTCPSTMADLAAARRRLPVEVRSRVSVVFVTEDPQVDTPEVLRAWLRGFDPSFVGLIGGNATTNAALKALRAPATEHTDDAVVGESVEHTGSVYAFAGSRVVVYTGGTTPREYAEDLSRLLRLTGAS